MSAVLAPLQKELTLSNTALGLLGSIFLWTYALGSIFAGALADRFSRTRLVLVSLFAWSLVMVFTGLSAGQTSLFALRFGLGATECLFLPAAIALIADYHTNATRGRAMSLMLVGQAAGVVVGGVVAGFMADHFGWRSGFLLLGCVGVLASLTTGKILVTPPVPASRRLQKSNFKEAIVYLAQVPSYYVLLIKVMLIGVAAWIFNSWLPLFFFERFKMSLAAAGFAGTFTLQVATMLGVVAGGWLSDAFSISDTRRRMLIMSTSYLVASPFLLLFLGEPSLMVVTVTVASFSFIKSLGSASEQPTVFEIIPARFRSTGIGLMNAAATAAGGLGVLVTGIFKQRLGLQSVFASTSLMFAGAGAILLIGYLFFMKRDIERARDYETQMAAAPL